MVGVVRGFVFAVAFVVRCYFADYSELVIRFNSVVDCVLVDLIYVDFGVILLLVCVLVVWLGVFGGIGLVSLVFWC